MRGRHRRKNQSSRSDSDKAAGSGGAAAIYSQGWFQALGGAGLYRGRQMPPLVVKRGLAGVRGNGGFGDYILVAYVI